MIEISSSDDDEDEVEGPDDDPSSPPARGSRMEQTSGETEAGDDDVEIEEDEEDMGANPLRRRNVEPRFETFAISLRRWLQQHHKLSIVSFVEEHMTLKNALYKTMNK